MPRLGTLGMGSTSYQPPVPVPVQVLTFDQPQRMAPCRNQMLGESDARPLAWTVQKWHA